MKRIKYIVIFCIKLIVFYSCAEIHTELDETEVQQKLVEVHNQTNDLIENSTHISNFIKILEENKDSLSYKRYDVNSSTFPPYEDDSQYELTGEERFEHTLFIFRNKLEGYPLSNEKIGNFQYEFDSFINNMDILNAKLNNTLTSFIRSRLEYKESDQVFMSEVNTLFSQIENINYIAFIDFKYVIEPYIEPDQSEFIGGTIKANVKVWDVKNKELHREFDAVASNSSTVYYIDDKHTKEKLISNLHKNLFENIKYQLYHHR